MWDSMVDALFGLFFAVLFVAMIGIACIGFWLSYQCGNVGFSNNYLDIYDIFAVFMFSLSSWAIAYAFIQAHEF